MAVFGITKTKLEKISPNVIVILLPILAVVATAILFFFLTRFGLSHATSTFKELSSTKKVEKQLEQKVSDLSQMQAIVLDQSNIAILALPSKNPGAVVIQAIKSYAAKNFMELEKIELANVSEAAGANKIKLRIETKGGSSVFSIVDLVKSVSEGLPLVTIEVIDVKFKGDELIVKLTFGFIGRLFPKSCPQLMSLLRHLPKMKMHF